MAEWDGRNERLASKNRDTAHRIQTFITNILTQESAVGAQNYIDEFDRGFSLLRDFAKARGVELGYFGDSSYGYHGAPAMELSSKDHFLLPDNRLAFRYLAMIHEEEKY